MEQQFLSILTAHGFENIHHDDKYLNEVVKKLQLLKQQRDQKMEDSYKGRGGEYSRNVHLFLDFVDFMRTFTTYIDRSTKLSLTPNYYVGYHDEDEYDVPTYVLNYKYKNPSRDESEKKLTFGKIVSAAFIESRYPTALFLAGGEIDDKMGAVLKGILPLAGISINLGPGHFSDKYAKL